jgi:hypothetical protein
VTLNLS